eukprot:8932953-Pyramimonas_sp.AAC.1
MCKWAQARRDISIRRRRWIRKYQILPRAAGIKRHRLRVRTVRISVPLKVGGGGDEWRIRSQHQLH